MRSMTKDGALDENEIRFRASLLGLSHAEIEQIINPSPRCEFCKQNGYICPRELEAERKKRQ